MNPPAPIVTKRPAMPLPDGAGKGRVRPFVFFDTPRGPRPSHDRCDNVVASLTLPARSPVFDGHYPGHPLLPGALMLEAALQAMEAAGAGDDGQTLFLRRIDSLQLIRSVRPGETFTIEASRRGEGEAAARMSWKVALRDAQRRRIAAVTLVVSAASMSALPRATPVSDDGLDAGQTVLDAVSIVGRLPHRAPLLLVDRAVRAASGDFLRAQRAVRIDHPDLGEGEPTSAMGYPATLALESCAQAAGLLALDTWNPPRAGMSRLLILGGAGRVDIHGEAMPGEVMVHELRVTRRFSGAVLVSGTTCVDGRVLMDVHNLLLSFRDEANSGEYPPCTVHMDGMTAEDSCSMQ